MPRLISAPNSAAACQFCRTRPDDPKVLAQWFFYAEDTGTRAFNAMAVCQRHALRLVGEVWANCETLKVNGTIVDVPLLLRTGEGRTAPEHMESSERFELREDEDTGRPYWWGAEDGWKDATEVGEDGVLTLSSEHFAMGTILTITEPDAEDTKYSGNSTWGADQGQDIDPDESEGETTEDYTPETDDDGSDLPF